MSFVSGPKFFTSSPFGGRDPGEPDDHFDYNDDEDDYDHDGGDDDDGYDDEEEDFESDDQEGQKFRSEPV